VFIRDIFTKSKVYGGITTQLTRWPRPITNSRHTYNDIMVYTTKHIPVIMYRYAIVIVLTRFPAERFPLHHLDSGKGRRVSAGPFCSHMFRNALWPMDRFFTFGLEKKKKMNHRHVMPFSMEHENYTSTQCTLHRSLLL